MSEKYRVIQDSRGYFFPQWKSIFGNWKNFYGLYETREFFNTPEKALIFIMEYLKSHRKFFLFRENVEIIKVLHNTSYVNKKGNVEDSNFEEWREE